MIKKCTVCNNDFNTRDKRRKYCSLKCYRKIQPNVCNGYKKGHIPWNSGIKGLRFSIDTEFKKGQKSLRWCPIGTIKIRTAYHHNNEKRRYIKIAEPNIWREYYKHIWMQKNGSIPSGMIIHHVDGNTLNDKIENLQCLTRAQHINIHRDLLEASNPKLNYLKAERAQLKLF